MLTFFKITFFQKLLSGILLECQTVQIQITAIFLPEHPASFVLKFVSGMQSFYFIESQDAMVLQTCHEK